MVTWSQRMALTKQRSGVKSNKEGGKWLIPNSAGHFQSHPATFLSTVHAMVKKRDVSS